MNFTTLLMQLDKLLRQHRPAYYAQLNPAATPQELAAFEADFGWPLPPELRTWFSWRNGQAAQVFDSLVGSYTFPSLDEIAETVRINRELLADGDFAPDWWSEHWLPWLTNGSGDHLCLDLDGTFTQQPGQVLEHWHDGPERTVLFPDFKHWLTAVVQAYEAQLALTPMLTEDLVADLELISPPGFPLEFEAGEFPG